MRSYAREVAFCRLYQNLFNSSDLPGFNFFDTQKIDKADLEFINRVTIYAIANIEEIDKKIAILSHGFKLERIFRVDLALLELAIAEMSCIDTPKPVVVNEIVELAKRYSSPKSVSYVNGILASYLKENQ